MAALPLRLALGLAVALTCSSCARLQQSLNRAPAKLATATDAVKTALAAPARAPSYWKADEATGAAKIRIVLAEQRAYFYKGKTLVGESNISTGRKGYETPPGEYHVIQKDKDHVSNLYGEYIDADGDVVMKNVDVTKNPQPEGTAFQGAKMPFFLRFTKGYGMHAGFVPRYRASHGCIRMPRTMAEHFFDAASEGTQVTVEE